VKKKKKNRTDKSWSKNEETKSERISKWMEKVRNRNEENKQNEDSFSHCMTPVFGYSEIPKSHTTYVNQGLGSGPANHRRKQCSRTKTTARVLSRVYAGV